MFLQIQGLQVSGKTGGTGILGMEREDQGKGQDHDNSSGRGQLGNQVEGL